MLCNRHPALSTPRSKLKAQKVNIPLQQHHPPTRVLFGTMAATQKLYPRGTVKRIVKAHSTRSVSKNADILVRPNSPRVSHCVMTIY